MILDGINMEPGARRGLEKITREIRKKLIWRRSIHSTIGLTLFALASYFKKTQQYQYQYIPIVIVLISNGIIFSYNAYLLKSTGQKVVDILSKTVHSNSNIKKNYRTESDYKLSKAYKKFERMLLIVLIILISSSFIIFGTALWAIIAINYTFGMYLNSPYIAMMVSGWMSAFVISNRLFIIWFQTSDKDTPNPNSRVTTAYSRKSSKALLKISGSSIV